jgi:hypothetical protein
MTHSVKHSHWGVDCDVIAKTVNAHLNIGKYCGLANEITDYKTVALECLFTTP